MDLHHNLFYGYRGPHSADSDRERQLENNVTKALINTLRLGGESVWRPFLAELGVSDGNEAVFLLQRADLPSGSAALRQRCVLLGISPSQSRWSPEDAVDETYASIPDAWIYGEGFAVLVESKVAGDFINGQMQSHLARLQDRGHREPVVVLKTWRQVYDLFRRQLPSLTGASALLVQQFIEFLEYSDMSGFTGFRREHFDYFLSHDDDDARRWVRAQVTDFADRAQKRLCEFADFYESSDVGTLRQSDSYCWVAFGPASGAYRKVTHQSISLSFDGVKVFVNAELKSATDHIKSVLRQSAHALRLALQKLHDFEPFELVLEERVQRQASIYDYTPKMRLHSSLLSDESVGSMAWMAFVETVQRLPLPYLRIERLVQPRTLLELSAHNENKAIDRIAEVIRQNHSVVKILND